MVIFLNVLFYVIAVWGTILIFTIKIQEELKRLENEDCKNYLHDWMMELGSQFVGSAFMFYLANSIGNYLIANDINTTIFFIASMVVVVFFSSLTYSLLPNKGNDNAVIKFIKEDKRQFIYFILGSGFTLVIQLLSNILD